MWNSQFEQGLNLNISTLQYLLSAHLRLLIWKLTCICKWDTPGLWNIDPFRFMVILKNLQADNKTQYLLQNPYMHGVFKLLDVYCIQVLKCSMTRPGNSAHQCLVTKINMTILKLIRNPIFKEQSFECIGNFRNKDVFTRKLISTC